MGSIRGLFFLLFLFSLFPLFAQNGTSRQDSGGTVSIAFEISRLENISNAAGQITASTGERYNAFMSLVRLYQLSGDPEAALKACEGALTVSPGDSRALLAQARLLLSMGEYEKADAALKALPRTGLDSGLLIQGQYLAALLAAFGSSNTQPLAALADNPDYAANLSGIYYTLWKLTGLSSWKTRLSSEFPQSPEAKIAAVSAGVNSAPAPLWLLFPGRDSISLSSPVSSLPPPQAAGPDIISPAAPPDDIAQSSVLQTGLFGREENAKAMAERLKKAGFSPQIAARKVNGNDYWAVSVSGGKDMNATIKKLKDAGFEAFPAK